MYIGVGGPVRLITRPPLCMSGSTNVDSSVDPWVAAYAERMKPSVLFMWLSTTFGSCHLVLAP